MNETYRHGQGSSSCPPSAYVLIAAAAALALTFMAGVELSGDESDYADGARGLAQALLSAFHGEPARLAVAFDRIRGPGFFMPGMPLILTPIALIFGGEAPAWALRLGMVLLNAALLVAICRALSRDYSSRAALVFLALPLLSPYYVFFLSTLWSDIVATHVAILFLIWLDRRLRAGGTLPAFRAGAVVAVVTYLRSSYLPLILVLPAAWLLQALHSAPLDRQVLLSTVRQALVAGLAFFAFVLPWSVYVSVKYGPTLTVTSAPISQIVLLGDEAYLRELAADARRFGSQSLFLAAHHRVAVQAEKAGRSFSAQARLERGLATRGLTLRTALTRLSRSVAHYFGRPHQFIDRFWSLRCRNRPCGETAWRLVRTQNGIAYAGTLLVGLALFVCPWGVGRSGHVPAFLFKALVFLICLLPYLVTGHGRYHVQLYPAVSLGLSILATGGCGVYSFDRRRAPHDALIGAGQLLAAVFAVATLLLAALFACGVTAGLE